MRFVAHLAGVDEGHLRLFFKRSRASIPELPGAEHSVEQGRRVADSTPSADSLSNGPAIGEGPLWIVAGSAADRAVGGQARFEEEHPAELYFGGGHRVVSGDKVRPEVL